VSFGVSSPVFKHGVVVRCCVHVTCTSQMRLPRSLRQSQSLPHNPSAPMANINQPIMKETPPTGTG
jgi:hypothetical protein